jgi:transcriptional regulator with PAS, ATPase and Fis domain
LGSSRTKTVDVRVVCATNRPLEQMVEEGTFREDLLYRINLITIKLPALRERPNDIPLLVDFFINNLGKFIASPTLKQPGLRSHG